MTDRAPVRQWDPWKLMNVSTEELKAIDERKQMKNELKAKWQRMSTNPHAGGQGGHQLDPAVQRWLSARVTASEHFKVTTRTSIPFYLGVVIPIITLTYLVDRDRRNLDAKCRSGEITPRERIFKWKH